MCLAQCGASHLCGRGISVPLSLEAWKNARRCLISPHPTPPPSLMPHFYRKGRSKCGSRQRAVDWAAGKHNEQAGEMLWPSKGVDKDDAFLTWIIRSAWGRQGTVTRNFSYPDRCGKSGLLRVISLSFLKKQCQDWYREKLLFWTSFRPTGKNLLIM